jgi:hypothetical protein
MMGISLTVIVCAVTLVAAPSDQENGQVSVCQLYSEVRPIADLRSCLYPPLRDSLGREALERAGRKLEPDESVETTCRMMTGGVAVAG